MIEMTPDIQGFIAAELFNAVPVSICVIDKQRNIIHANRRFRKVFGEWHGRKCYQVNKAHEEPCRDCVAGRCFADGQPRQNREFGYNQRGKPAHYIKHSIPIRGLQGEISFLVEMYFDITDKERLRQENEMLFEQVPCNMTLLDRELNIVRANRRVRDKFGNVIGKRCYEVFRRDKHPCADCPTHKTFQDGQVHVGQSVVENSRGDQFSFQVTTAPIAYEGEDYVLEMAVNITESLDLRDQLSIAHAFLETIVVTSMDGIVAIDSERNVIILNPAARKLLGLGPKDTLLGGQLCSMLPPGFFQSGAKRRTVFVQAQRFHHQPHRRNPFRALGGRETGERREASRLGVFPSGSKQTESPGTREVGSRAHGRRGAYGCRLGPRGEEPPDRLGRRHVHDAYRSAARQPRAHRKRLDDAGPQHRARQHLRQGFPAFRQGALPDRPSLRSGGHPARSS